MNKRQVVRFFKNLRYKPNVSFTHRFEDNTLVVEVKGFLAEPHTDKTATISSEETFNYKGVNESQLLSAIRDWLHAAECHEADEWLLFNGKKPFDPHKAKISLYYLLQDVNKTTAIYLL